MLIRLVLLYLGSFLLLAGIVTVIGLRRIVATALTLPFVTGAAAVIATALWVTVGMR
jgi:hypothetical protein